MNKQIGSVLTLEHPDFKVKIGTFNKKEPSTIYFDGGIYISPLEKKDSYSEDLQKIKTASENEFRIALGNRISNKYIFVEELAEGRLSPSKKTYLTFQAHIKPINYEGKTFKEVSKEMEEPFKAFLEDFEDTIKSYGFAYSKTK